MHRIDYNTFLFFTAYFYVLNVPDPNHDSCIGRFQFMPVNEPDLYIAVVNGKLALKVGISTSRK